MQRHHTLSSSGRTLLQAWLAYGVLLVGALYFLMPWRPVISKGLDYALGLMLNVAHQQHLQFGKDILFTYGCLGFVERGDYYPATRSLVLVLTIMLIVLWTASMWLTAGRWIARNVWLRALTLLLVVVASLAITPWFTLVSTAGAAMIACPDLRKIKLRKLWPRTTGSQGRQGSARAQRRRWLRAAGWAMLLLFAGIVSNMKLTYDGMFVGLLLTTMLALLASPRNLSPRNHASQNFRGARPWGVVVLLPCVYLVGWLVSWLAMGQSLGGVPTYLRGMAHIVSSYGDSASFPGRTSDVVVLFGALVLTAVAAGGLFWRQSHSRLEAMARLLGILGLLFILFKSGVVRLGEGHLVLASCALTGVMLLLTAAIVARWRVNVGWRVLTVVVLVGLPVGASWWFGNGPAQHFERVTSLGLAREVGSFLVHGDRVIKAQWADQQIDVRKHLPYGRPGMTTDIYPGRLEWIIWSGLNVDARPGFLSYIAADPMLLDMNRQHLLGAKAPQRVLLSDERLMDDHYPALVDSLSWPVLWTHYDVIRRIGTSLELIRNDHPRAFSLSLPTSQVIHLGQQADVPVIPPGAKGIWATVTLKPTLWGGLRGLLYKRPLLLMDVTHANGRTSQYRFIPGMGRAGFLLSPRINFGTTWAVFATTDSQDKTLDPFKVRSIRIYPLHPARFKAAWQSEIHVDYQVLELQPQLLSLGGP